MVQVIASLKINPDEPEAVEEYFGTMMPLADKVGARLLQKIEIQEPIVGGWDMETILQLKYPDRTAVSRIFDSTQYQSIVPVRDRAFLKYDVCIVGTDVMEDIKRHQLAQVGMVTE